MHWPPLAALLLLAMAVPAAAGDDDWVVLKNDSETVEIIVPKGFTALEIKNPARLIHVQYSGEPFLSTQVKVYGHLGQTNIEHYVKFVQRDVGGGSLEFVEGSTTRFTTERQSGDGTHWVSYCDARSEVTWGYYVEILVPRDVFTAHRATFDRMIDSFRPRPAPQDAFTVPPKWRKVENDLFAVIGPVDELEDAAAKKQLENRLFRISTWMDVQAPHTRMLRDFTGDKRRIVARSVIQVFPTREAFRAAAGDHYAEGVFAVYLPRSPERAVVVDGSPESGVSEAELAGAVGTQYLDTRMAPLLPWVRTALRLYFQEATKRKSMPGLMTPEMLKRGKEVFSRNPPPFDEIIAKDEMGLMAMGETGAVAAWGYLQFGLHGHDAPLRNMFNRFMRDLVGAYDCAATWEKAVASWQEATKKKWKGRDMESGAKKYFKDLKE